jgi:Reverse transcriptase (RNA-dependent DNA polymerase)
MVQEISFMVSLNFSRSNYDNCVYLKRLDGGNYIYLLLYVDDILIAATNMGAINKLKEQLGMAFEMKDLGAAKKILGMKIIRDRSNRKLFLS